MSPSPLDNTKTTNKKTESIHAPLLIHNARLATPVASTNGAPNWQLKEIFPAALYCENDRIVQVGQEQAVVKGVPACEQRDGDGDSSISGMVTWLGSKKLSLCAILSSYSQ